MPPPAQPPSSLLSVPAETTEFSRNPVFEFAEYNISAGSQYPGLSVQYGDGFWVLAPDEEDDDDDVDSKAP